MSNDIPDDQLRSRLQEWFQETPSLLTVATAIRSQVCLGTTVGLKRKENQDRAAFLRVRSSRPDRRAFVVAAVCDGMGGMVDGAACADLAISAFLTYVVRSKEANLAERLRRGALSANELVFRSYSARGGATLSAFAIEEGGSCVGVNIGDSRIYKISSQAILEQLTIDDTIGGQLQAMNKEVPLGLNEYNQLVQFIGMGTGIEPRVIELNIRSDDNFIVITSDGAHAHHPSTFLSLCNNAESGEDLIKRLLVTSEWIGGHDNATAVSFSLKGWQGLFETPHESAGVFEVWSPAGKVAFWGLQQQAARYMQPHQAYAPDQNPKNKALSEKPISNSGISSDSTGGSPIQNEAVPREHLFDNAQANDRAQPVKRKQGASRKKNRTSESGSKGSQKKKTVEGDPLEHITPKLDIFVSDDGENK